MKKVIVIDEHEYASTSDARGRLWMVPDDSISTIINICESIAYKHPSSGPQPRSNQTGSNTESAHNPGPQPEQTGPVATGADLETVLQEARRIINGSRRADYGDSRESFELIAAGWTNILQKKLKPFTGINSSKHENITAEDVGLLMIWLKLARFLNSHDRDSLVDLAGYTGLTAYLAGIDVDL